MPETAARQVPSPDGMELLGLEPGELGATLGAFLAEADEPSYRLEQLRHWAFDRRAESFSEITTLPLGLRERLAERYSLTPLTADHTARSEDGTTKHLWRLGDGERVESVLIPTRSRLTLCLSSQAGCALGCRFCATGWFGFRRQLRAAEIAAQYRSAARYAEGEMGRRITNLVYMGMGEPLANLEAVLRSLEVLGAGFGVGARRITLSTVGLVPGIRRLAERPEAWELAVSLHAPTHELRAEIVPVERRWPLDELFAALRYYQARKGRRISLEYTMIDRLNDGPGLAAELARRAEGLDVFVNLIPFNPIPDRPAWRASPPARIAAFARALHRSGISAAVREPRGRDVAAACGQLRLERGALTEA